ncbi:transglutaminaseTgpA domain-containing protein [Arthrobacter sp.]|uniref:transglutaminase family protein n=1 Tax=Arthrobacter sp. TaxID=1667 RepID=UPI003A8F498F
MNQPTRSLRSHLPTARRAIDAGVLLLCLTLGVLGLHAAFGGNARYLYAGIGGAVLGLALAYCIVRYRLAFLPAAGIGIGIYLLMGTILATPAEAFAGVLPTLESLRTLLAGVVLSWKDVLTVAPPVGIRSGMLVVPFLSAYVTALVAGLLAWRLRSPFFSTIPVIAMFVVGIIFGTREVPLPLVRGLVLVMALVCWLAWRRQVDRAVGPEMQSLHDAGASTLARAGLLRRVGMEAIVLLVAGGLTAIAAPTLQSGEQRQVLRDAVVPPIDLYDYPSPLMRFRTYVKDKTEEPLLSVTGLPEGQRVRLAALDTYDGLVYNVDPRSGGNFTPVGDASQVNDAGSRDARRSRGTLGITIEGYDGVWVPGGGKLLGLDVTGGNADLSRSLFYNDDAETALSTTGLHRGDSYTADVEFPVQIDRKKLQAFGLSDITMPRLSNVPQVVSGKAADMAGDGDTGVERAAAMEGILHETGYFSNGKENEVPSLSGHGAARIAALLDADAMIGDDEQYAVAMALMARDQGMPARVVMGFYPEKYDPAGTVQLTGADVHAWVEINFENVGWVAFTPTPDKDKEPTPPQQEPQSVPQPQVLQPPPPPQDDAKLPPETAPDPQDADDTDDGFWAFWGPILQVIGYIAIPVAILLLPLLVIALLKLRRRKRRRQAARPGDRVSGGWNEVIALATDLGSRPDPKGTRRENAKSLVGDFPDTAGTSVLLARRADAAVFGDVEPTDAQVADYWQHVDEHLVGMSSSVGFWGRLRGKYSPRSLVLDANARITARRAHRGEKRGAVRRVDTNEDKE